MRAFMWLSDTHTHTRRYIQRRLYSANVIVKAVLGIYRTFIPSRRWHLIGQEQAQHPCAGLSRGLALLD